MSFARTLERQRDEARQGVAVTFSAYLGTADVARAAIGAIKAALENGLHGSREKLETVLPMLEKRLADCTELLTRREKA